MKFPSIDLKQICKGCPKFLEQRDYALKHCDSVFDAVFDVEQFQEKCSTTCEKVKKILEDTSDV